MTKGGGKEFVTREVLDEAVETILNGMNRLLAGSSQETNSRLDKMVDSLKSVKTELAHVKDEINGLKADLSDTPSRKEFENLKTRVDEHYPLS
jgi:archaellum component FlaC